MQNTLLLDALQGAKIFILYRVEPRLDGKTDKIPTDPATGASFPKDSGGHINPANWMLPHEALLWAQQYNENKAPGVLSYGVGISIYEGSQLFALDFDQCRAPNGGWLPHVVSFEGRFPGAYRETSVSTNGRHIIGCYSGTIAKHRTKNKKYAMEAYTRGRFIALGMLDAEGSVLTDCTKALTAFLDEFFPEIEEAEHGVEWTSAPVAVWKGPTDDTQLIARALKSHGVRAIFGGGASFIDLWQANAEILGKVFPSSTGRPWDGSSADQALANHLAFWTGNDCERMLRLMFQSGLVRDKWARIEDYVKPTILNACRTQTEFYEEKTPSLNAIPEAPAAPGPIPPPPPEVNLTIQVVGPMPIPPPPGPVNVGLGPDNLPQVGEYCGIQTLKQLFKGMCYVQEIHAIQLPDGSAVSKERFDSMYGGPQYAMTADGQKPSKSAWDAYTLSEIHRFPRVEAQYFRPQDTLGNIRTREGRREINTYKPANVRRVSGDPTPFLDLVRKMLPNGRDAEILISYMAACVQNLGIKFTWWPFVQGAKGNGKTTIGKVLEYCMSHRYTHWAKADQLGEKFNSVLVGKLLVIVDEMYSDDARQLQEILKQMVTADRIEVRPMYAEKTMKEVCFNGLLFSNHQNGVRIDLDERRYAPLFCAQQSKADRIKHGLTGEYFIALRRWLWGNDSEGAAIVFDYLSNLAIADDLNPATDCIYAPTTTSTELAATASLGGVEQEIVEAIKQEHVGFRGGWVSSIAVDMLLLKVGKDKAIPRNARRNIILGLGYEPHPALPSGMLPVAEPDGSRPYLYVAKGHPWAVDYLTPDQVRVGFSEAQRQP
jgi:hypothetical protein